MFGWIGCQASQEIALWGQLAKKKWLQKANKPINSSKGKMSDISLMADYCQCKHWGDYSANESVSCQSQSKSIPQEPIHKTWSGEHIQT